MNFGKWNESEPRCTRTIKKDIRLILTMKHHVIALLVLMILSSSGFFVQAGGATGGEDINPPSDAPFTILQRTTPSQDGTTWTLSIEASEEAKDNGTTLGITTQICLNSGVCDPPVNQEAQEQDGVYTIQITPPTDHSYVNWRVKATYSDESSENFPQGDWYKTWSTCYYHDGSYSGIHAEGNGCKVPSSSEETSALSYISLPFLMTTLVFAFVATRRK